MKTKICEKCGQLISVNVFQKHNSSCDGSGTRRSKNPNPTKFGTEEYRQRMSKINKEHWEDERYRQKVINSLKGKSSGRASSKEKESERKRKISETMRKNKISGGLREGSGRGKKGWYKGFWCDSSWELAFVIFNIDHNIKFERNKKGFEYVFEGEKHKYYPDFIIENEHYEIKGYKTKQLEAKINQFEHILHLIDSSNVQKYLGYVVSEYGQDFIRLYEIGSVR